MFTWGASVLGEGLEEEDMDGDGDDDDGEDEGDSGVSEVTGVMGGFLGDGGGDFEGDGFLGCLWG